MKLPIPSLLYLASAGLFGLAGWTLYEMLPLLKDETRAAATQKGMQEATRHISKAKAQVPVAVDWQYTRPTAVWWAEFKDVNLIGKPPPKPAEEQPKGPEEQKPVSDARPLEQIFELVSLVYDGRDQGRGGNSHVIIRYRQEANVQPPEWYMRENAPPTAASNTAVAMPRDVARPSGRPPAPAAQPTPRPGPANRGTTPMPTSMVGTEYQQTLWVQGDGDPRHDARLWPPFSDIKLVRVDAEARSAFFVRDVAPPKDGEPAAEPKEEQLFKTSQNLDQEVMRLLGRLDGRSRPETTGAGQVPVAPTNTWLEVEETTQVGKVVNIGRKDEQLIRENPDSLFEQVNVDAYVNNKTGTKGLIVRNVEPKLAARFGVSQGDLLLEVNGRPVQTKAQAVQFGKAEYRKGVRTFTTKWLSNGQIVERVYQAPDR